MERRSPATVGGHRAPFYWRQVRCDARTTRAFRRGDRAFHGRLVLDPKRSSHRNASGPKLAPSRFRPGDRHPATCVRCDDARAFVRWLSRRTGKSYSPLSETECEGRDADRLSVGSFAGAAVRLRQTSTRSQVDSGLEESSGGQMSLTGPEPRHRPRRTQGPQAVSSQARRWVFGANISSRFRCSQLRAEQGPRSCSTVQSTA